jgi:hypothetical protein
MLLRSPLNGLVVGEGQVAAPYSATFMPVVEMGKNRDRVHALHDGDTIPIRNKPPK